MPIYEYKCPTCGNHEDIFKKLNNEATVLCSKCKEHMVKCISAPNFHLKGKNWAKDNYGLKNSKKGA